MKFDLLTTLYVVPGPEAPEPPPVPPLPPPPKPPPFVPPPPPQATGGMTSGSSAPGPQCTPGVVCFDTTDEYGYPAGRKCVSGCFF